MPRHEQVSPEEDLATYYAPEERRAAPSADAGMAEWGGPFEDPGKSLARVSRKLPVFSEPREPPPEGAPSPGLAAAMSAVLPGVGQMYAGQILKGSAILFVCVFTCSGGGLFNIIAAIDAFLVCRRIARGEPVSDWRSF